MNTRKVVLGRFGYQEAPIEIKIPKTVNLHEIGLEVSASVTIAGGSSSGTVQQQSVARLIQDVRFSKGREDYIAGVSGRDLDDLYPRIAAKRTPMTTLADADAQAGTAISWRGVIPFERRYLAEPRLTIWPGGMDDEDISLFVQLATDRINSNSSPGSAALVHGGDRTVTISNFQLVVTLTYSTGFIRPWYLPRMHVRFSPQANAAGQSELAFPRARRFDLVLFRWLEGPQQVKADRVANFAFHASAGGLVFVGGQQGGYPVAMLKEEELRLFPAIDPATDQLGVFALNPLDNGLLGGLVNPRTLQDPTFIFDHAAPSANPGQVRALFMELDTLPGVTQVQD